MDFSMPLLRCVFLYNRLMFKKIENTPNIEKVYLFCLHENGWMTFKSKIKIVSSLSEAEFDADIGCNLNLTLIWIYKVLTKIMVTTTAMMVTI